MAQEAPGLLFFLLFFFFPCHIECCQVSKGAHECSCEPVDWRKKLKRKGLTAITVILLDLYISASHGPAMLAAVLKAVHSYLATFSLSLSPFIFFFFFLTINLKRSKFTSTLKKKYWWWGTEVCTVGTISGRQQEVGCRALVDWVWGGQLSR